MLMNRRTAIAVFVFCAAFLGVLFGWQSVWRSFYVVQPQNTFRQMAAALRDDDPSAIKAISISDSSADGLEAIAENFGGNRTFGKYLAALPPVEPIFSGPTVVNVNVADPKNPGAILIIRLQWTRRGGWQYWIAHY